MTALPSMREPRTPRCVQSLLPTRLLEPSPACVKTSSAKNVSVVSDTNIYSQGNYLVSLIEGDGIGPEIAVSVKDIFAAAKVRIYLPPSTQRNSLRRSVIN